MGTKYILKMRHLGIMLDSKLDWYPHTLLLESKTLRICNNLAGCSRASWEMSYSNLVTVYSHAILPTITYTAESWTNRFPKELKTNCNKSRDPFLYLQPKSTELFYKRPSQQSLE
jgi:hypothetical protein